MDAEKAGLKLGPVVKPRKNGDEKRLPTDDAVPEEDDADVPSVNSSSAGALGVGLSTPPALNSGKEALLRKYLLDIEGLMLSNKNSSHQKVLTLSTDLFLELQSWRAFEHTSEQMFLELLTSHSAKDKFSTAGSVALLSIKGEEFKLNRFKGVNVASSHPLKFLFEATPRGDNGVKSARVNMLSLFLAVDFGLASFQTKEKQKSLTKENGIGEPASPSLPDISSGTSIKTNTEKQPDSPEVRENTQNVNGVGIGSQILEKLTPSVTSQKQIYTQDQIRSTSCLDRILIISKFIILTQLYIYKLNSIQPLLPASL